jgi:hypothetical protein
MRLRTHWNLHPGWDGRCRHYAGSHSAPLKSPSVRRGALTCVRPGGLRRDAPLHRRVALVQEVVDAQYGPR